MPTKQILDRLGLPLALGDWVKVKPKTYAQDLKGDLFSRTAVMGERFEAPSHLGTVIARVESLKRTDEDGVVLPGVIRVTWLSQHSGSQRSEDVEASDCDKVLEADGADVAEVGPA